MPDDDDDMGDQERHIADVLLPELREVIHRYLARDHDEALKRLRERLGLDER